MVPLNTTVAAILPKMAIDSGTTSHMTCELYASHYASNFLQMASKARLCAQCVCVWVVYVHRYMYSTVFRS